MLGAARAVSIDFHQQTLRHWIRPECADRLPRTDYGVENISSGSYFGLHAVASNHGINITKPIVAIASFCARAATGHVAAPPTSPMTPRRLKSRMESPLLLAAQGRTGPHRHSQSSAVWNVSQAGRWVLGLGLKCSESGVAATCCIAEFPSDQMLVESQPHSALAKDVVMVAGSPS